MQKKQQRPPAKAHPKFNATSTTAGDYSNASAISDLRRSTVKDETDSSFMDQVTGGLMSVANVASKLTKRGGNTLKAAKYGKAHSEDNEFQQATTGAAIIDTITDFSSKKGVRLFGTAVGSVASAAYIYQGAKSALDPTKSTEDRVLGGLGSSAGTLGLGARVAGYIPSIANAGAVGAAAGTASVLSAGMAGYSVGKALYGLSESDYGRDEAFGKGDDGRYRTSGEQRIDEMVAYNMEMDERGRRGNASLHRAGKSANQWIDDATGTDKVGDLVESGLGYVGDLTENVMDYGGGILAGGAVIGTSAVDTGIGAFTAISNWWNEDSSKDEGLKSLSERTEQIDFDQFKTQ